MASLDIPSEANNEDADIIIDYSSDENPYENPYTEYNFAQKRKKSYVDEDLQREFDYKPPTQTERFLYQRGMIKNKKNKWEQIPPQYIPKIPITRMDNDILNIDCETDVDETIQDWSNKLNPFICEFSDQYYKLDTTKQKAALEMFFNKLPESVSTKLKEMYNTLLQDGTTIQDTLGARITTLKAWMKKECLQETAKKEAQVKLCCEMQSDNIGNYGCS
ncbi:hypothetical protein Tco_0910867 [Tanacetum coccineum]|uniref:Uncharacterized protein n=1 Tax=Tanacetum coccineum TaxID=301880 RepID=A0ABQ5CVR3_9ASTR